MDRVILDLRGLAMHAYYSDKANMSAYVLNANGDRVPSAEHGVNRFIDIYLNPLLQEGWAPVQMIAVLEGSKGNARRRALNPAYKEKKEQDADDPVIAAQKKECMEGCQRLLLHLGATLVNHPFCEADDVIAHLLETQPGKHRLYTVDQDLLACSGPHVDIYITNRNFGVPELRTEFKGMDLTQVSPRMVTLYKSLVGDSSDGIKGVPQFGEKAFPKLFDQYGWDGLEQLADIVDSRNWGFLEQCVAGDPLFKPLKLIAENRENWLNSWNLAKLHPEWAQMNWGDKPAKMNWAKRIPLEENVRKELARFNLQDRFEEFSKYCVRRWVIDAPKMERLKANNEAGLSRMIADMNQASVLAFDYETYDNLQHEPYKVAGKGKFVDVLNSVPTGVSFCFGDNLNLCFYLSTNHRDTANCKLEDITMLLKRTEKTVRVAQNSMFESVVSARQLGYRFPHENLPHDTAVMSSYADENEDQGLKKLSKVYLNYDQINYNEVVAEGQDMRDLSADEVLQYGCDDSIVTGHLYVLFKTIMHCEGTWNFYEENERFFYEAHIDSFIKGVPVDFDRLSKLEAEDAEKSKQIEQEVRAILSERCREFNEQGFRTLHEEVRQYVEASYRTSCQKKGKEVDEKKLAKNLKNAEDSTREGCIYSEYRCEITDLLDRQVVSDVARSLKLAAIRSVKPKRLMDWIDGITLQNAEQESTFTPDQDNFLRMLGTWADTGDGSELQEFIQEYTKDRKEFWTGTELNVGSPKQMAQLFYGMLGLPILIRNEADEGSARDQFELEGAPATNDLAMLTWLVHLPESDWRREVIELIQEWKGLRQRNSLYYKPYPLWRSPRDGRLHPQFRNCGTVTRRPSGSNPNFLQISKIKDKGRVRSCIMPQSFDNPEIEEEVIVSIDWAQQEVRIAAAVSQDPGLLACYVGDKRTDVHTRASTRIVNILNKRAGKDPWTYEQYEMIRKNKDHPDNFQATEIRNKKGKPTVFLMIYAGSSVGLARKLVVSEDLSKEIFEEFFKEFPGLAARQKEVIATARKYGWTTTMFGNRKHATDILSKDGSKRAAAERQVVNMEEQGTAADVAKKTMRKWVLQDVPGKTGATLYAVVYDELVASVPKSKVGSYIQTVMGIMQITLPGTEVVLEAEPSFGPNWGDQIELGSMKQVSHAQALLDSQGDVIDYPAVKESLK